MPRTNRRNSLSSWWSQKGDRAETSDALTATDISDPEPEQVVLDTDDRGDDSGDSANKSPRKQPRFTPGNSPSKSDKSKSTIVPTFFMGDDSDVASARSSLGSHSLQCSPRKRTGSRSVPRKQVASRGSDDNVSTAMMSILRRICSEYFENNVSPVLKFIQQTQEQLVTEVKDLSAAVKLKANREDVTALTDIERIASRAANSKTEENKVAIHVRLEKIESAMKQKANAVNVATLAQLGLKANAKDVATSAQLAQLAAAVEQKVDMADVLKGEPAQSELESRLRTAEQRVTSLSDELRALKAADSTGASANPQELAKIKAVFAAAGLRVDKQLKEIRQQLKCLSEECVGKDVGDARWPGRKLPVETASAVSFDKISVHSDDSLGKYSLTSAGGLTSLGGLDPEEKAELKKIKTIVAAAGTVLNKEVRGLKQEIRELRAELQAVKTSAGDPEPRSS